jgi:hypothetical protein
VVSAPGQLFGDGAASVPSHGVEVEDQLDGGCFLLDGHEVVGVRVELVALGCDAEGPLALAAEPVDAVD